MSQSWLQGFTVFNRQQAVHSTSIGNDEINRDYNVICQKYGHFLLVGRQETKNTSPINLYTDYVNNFSSGHRREFLKL